MRIAKSRLAEAKGRKSDHADPIPALDRSNSCKDVIEPFIIAMQHVGEEICFVIWRFPRPGLPGRVGYLGLAGRNPEQVF